jgi:hypothetical protein
LLTTTATVEEARQAMAHMQVVGVLEPAVGVAPPIHPIVTDPGGKATVIEFARKEVQIFDAPLGVITNARSNDGHLMNLRNCLSLSAVSLPDKTIEDLRKMPTLRGAMPRETTARQALCADIDGFSLHAAVRVGAHDRKRLERLCRCITRPALSDERIQVNEAGHCPGPCRCRMRWW